MLAKPRRKPGTGKGMGRRLSIYEKIMAIAVKRAQAAMIFASVVFFMFFFRSVLFMVLFIDVNMTCVKTICDPMYMTDK